MIDSTTDAGLSRATVETHYVVVAAEGTVRYVEGTRDATLELRGYGSARHAPRARRAWSRHDLAFTAAALALVALAVAGEVTGMTRFAAYPRLEVASGPGLVAIAVAIVGCALAPFADRRGIER